jgi:hypothetical protein
MARPPKETSRKNNPNFSPVTAQIPKLLGRRLRLFVAQAELTISEVVQQALEEFLDKRNVRLPEESSTPESFKELVRNNYFDLINAGKIPPARLKELAFGEKPNTAELVIISNVLEMEEEWVVELRDRSFPKQTKPKQTNGTT